MVSILLLFWLSFLPPSALLRTASAPPELPERTRDEIIATARRLEQHQWICREPNRRAPCVTVAPYNCDFAANATVRGIAYDWGGMDGPEDFDRKLAQGKAAGSHQWHGVTSCTAGTDCSGFVSYCWFGTSPPRKYGTVNVVVDSLAIPLRGNWFTDMKPGDAFNKPGSHIVLFAGYHSDGRPIFYEASGGANKVIRKIWDWSGLQGYYAIEYRRVVD